MNPEDLPAFAQILRRQKVPYIIVGGAAVELVVPSASRDVDAMVLPREYGRAAKAVEGDPRVVSVTGDPTTLASGTFLSGRTLVRFDLLHPGSFVPEGRGEEFFDYVLRYHSVETPNGRVARPWVVWYTRLILDDWRTYVEKILRDLRSGAPWSWADKAIVIARHFGTETTLKARVLELQEVARLAGLLS